LKWHIQAIYICTRMLYCQSDCRICHILHDLDTI
jgi:hypothetical protein